MSITKYSLTKPIALDQVGGGVMRSRWTCGVALSKRAVARLRVVATFLFARKCSNNIPLVILRGIDSDIVFDVRLNCEPEENTYPFSDKPNPNWCCIRGFFWTVILEV